MRLIIVLALAVLARGPRVLAFEMEWVKIGDAGNAGEQSRLENLPRDTTYYGGVDYEYYIGKYEVTNNQYCEFLNTVDPCGTNLHGLYHPYMGEWSSGGITFGSGRPDGSKYSVKTGRGNNPVTFVGLCDIYRFANWMHNGQSNGSTETGAYDLVRRGCDYLVWRNRGARVFLPNEDEWYKAAYYKGGGLDAGYWDYATASDTCPVSEAPPGGGNSANYWTPSGYPVEDHHISDAGAYVNSPSAYGTFDQNGNVQEWADTRGVHPYVVILRGGSYHSEASWLSAPYRDWDDYVGGHGYGFRLASIPEPKVYYVDDDAAAGGDGESWAAAFTHLQDALSAAGRNRIPHEIRVAEGTYKPDRGIDISPGERTASFELIRGTNVEGGYAGLNQPHPNARDIHKYKTILSGDLNGDDVDVGDPCDLWNEPSRAENSFHVVTGYGTDETAVLDGFTITGGNASEDLSAPELPDPNNVGGGIYSDGCGLTLTNCTLIGNSAWYGGGIYHDQYITESPILKNCVLTRNAAGSCGGGMFSYGGYYDLARPVLSNCTFSDNSAPKGSAIACDSPQSIYGYIYSNDIQLTNCILWDNGSEIWNNDGSDITISYSNIRGGENGVYDPCSTVIWGYGNIDTDPCFADARSGDCHLRSKAGRYDPSSQSWVLDEETSPCIDAGDPMTPIALEPFPNGGIVNMGTYGGTPEASKSYFGKPPCETIMAGDVNGDCIIDFEDFRLMGLHWLENH